MGFKRGDKVIVTGVTLYGSFEGCEGVIIRDSQFHDWLVDVTFPDGTHDQLGFDAHELATQQPATETDAGERVISRSMVADHVATGDFDSVWDIIEALQKQVQQGEFYQQIQAERGNDFEADAGAATVPVNVLDFVVKQRDDLYTELVMAQSDMATMRVDMHRLTTETIETVAENTELRAKLTAAEARADAAQKAHDDLLTLIRKWTYTSMDGFTVVTDDHGEVAAAALQAQGNIDTLQAEYDNYAFLCKEAGLDPESFAMFKIRVKMEKERK